MAINFQLEPLLTELLRKIVETMRLEGGSFLLSTEGKFQLAKSYGYSRPPTFDLYSQERFKELQAESRTLLDEELPEGDLKEILHDLGAAAVVPLIAEKDFVGFLILSGKKSGEVLGDQDGKVIEILGPEISVAVANAQAVDKIERFNITLREEVERATRELRAANDELKKLDQMKDDFFSIASHELRTPLTAIRGNAALILERFDGSDHGKLKDSDLKEMTEDIKASSERLGGIVNDYLNMSRLEQGRMQFNVTSVDLTDLAKGVIKDLETVVAAKKLYLKLTEPTGEIPKVRADSDKVKEILINLIGNSIKFTDQGGITIDLAPQDKVVKILVSDTGRGIPKDAQGMLFRKFQQVQANQSTGAKGTGLGLYISKLMAEGMKGSLILERSEEGAGSTFALTLPMAG